MKSLPHCHCAEKLQGKCLGVQPSGPLGTCWLWPGALTGKLSMWTKGALACGPTAHEA